MLIERESIRVPSEPAVGDAFLLMEWVPHAYNKQTNKKISENKVILFSLLNYGKKSQFPTPLFYYFAI